MITSTGTAPGDEFKGHFARNTLEWAFFLCRSMNVDERRRYEHELLCSVGSRADVLELHRTWTTTRGQASARQTPRTQAQSMN